MHARKCTGWLQTIKLNSLGVSEAQTGAVLPYLWLNAQFI